jgi:hypothetical protein
MNDLSNMPDLNDLEAKMLLAPQVECPVTNHFGPNLYIREVFLPANTFALGHAHKKETMNILLKGKMAIFVDGEVKLIEGPLTFMSEAGRKLAYILEDCVFQNVYSTNETDLDILEEMLVDKSPQWIEQSDMKKLIEHVNGGES